MSRMIKTWAGNQPAISCPRTRHEEGERQRRQQREQEKKEQEKKEQEKKNTPPPREET
jgi:hypothetical protein